MKLCISTFFACLAYTANVGAAKSPLPAQILCTPDEHHRVGIEKLDLPGSVAHLLEYGGRVTFTQEGQQTHYSYGKGQDFYYLKEKTAYSNDFVNIQHDIFLYSDPGWADGSGVLILRAHSGSGFFHIDWTKQSYYAYTQELGAIYSFAGSCTVLKK